MRTDEGHGRRIGVVPTFPLRDADREMWQRNQELIRKLERETGRTLAEERIRLQMDEPVDGRGLRGIPVVGARGAGGAIRGTQPGSNLFR
jgi:hypothetical protein